MTRGSGNQEPEVLDPGVDGVDPEPSVALAPVEGDVSSCGGGMVLPVSGVDDGPGMVLPVSGVVEAPGMVELPGVDDMLSAGGDAGALSAGGVTGAGAGVTSSAGAGGGASSASSEHAASRPSDRAAPAMAYGIRRVSISTSLIRWCNTYCKGYAARVNACKRTCRVPRCVARRYNTMSPPGRLLHIGRAV